MTRETRRPEGMLVAIGGGEEREYGKDVLRRVIGLARAAPRVAVVPTAAHSPRRAGDRAIDALRGLGVRDVDVVDVRTRGEAHEDRFVERIDGADIILLTGGDQLRLTSVLGGSPLFHAIVERYERGAVLVGAGAGASALSDTVISEGPAEPDARADALLTPGLGLLKNAVLDTHFAERGRFTRLLQVVGANPGHIGLGLGEDAGVVIRDGRTVEVVGPGLVVVVDGHDLRHCNLSSVKRGAPVVVENVIVHTLAEGYRYDLDEQRYLAPAQEKARVREVEA